MDNKLEAIVMALVIVSVFGMIYFNATNNIISEARITISATLGMLILIYSKLENMERK